MKALVILVMLALATAAFAQPAPEVITVDAAAGVTACEVEQSTDAGVTWAVQAPQVKPSGTPSVCVFMIQTPANGRTLYRWAYLYGTTRVLRTDAGVYTCVGLADCPLVPNPQNIGVK